MSTERTLAYYNIQVCHQLEQYSGIKFWSVQLWKDNYPGNDPKNWQLVWEGQTVYEPETDAEEYKLLDITLDELVSEALAKIKEADCLAHNEGKFDAGCTCEKGIAERVKKV